MSFDSSQALSISHHADLKSRDDGDVLVLPERAIRLGGSGGEILRLCKESRSPRSIVATMQDRYPDAVDIEEQVLAFLEEMLELGGIVPADCDAEKKK